jgi:DNA invertase Pin-like site-specific DNA recombinase
MSKKMIGYIRVSDHDQNPERQLDGVALDKLFTEKACGRDIQSPFLEEVLGYVREVDTLVVHMMDRLAPNLEHLRKIVRELTEKGVKVQFMKEDLIFTGTDSAIATLLLSVVETMAEFERSFIRDRQREGVAIAKNKGLYGWRKKSLNNTHTNELKKMISEGARKSSVARSFNITRETFYKYMKLSNSQAIS